MTKISQIAIIMNDRSYEYDVYTLVIAFFQGIRTKVLDPGRTGQRRRISSSKQGSIRNASSFSSVGKGEMRRRPA